MPIADHDQIPLLVGADSAIEALVVGGDALVSGTVISVAMRIYVAPRRETSFTNPIHLEE